MEPLTPEFKQGHSRPRRGGITRAINRLRGEFAFLAICAVLAVAGCTTTPKGSFCALADAHRPANVDALTDAEVAQLLKHNAKGAKLCGWKP
jgi:hypothetical protein